MTARVATRFLAGVLLTSVPVIADTHYVDVNSANPVSPYTTWTTAATNIQNAIDVSTDGDTVLVANGIYATGGRVVYGAMTNRVAITKAISVQSVNGPTVTSIQGMSPVGDNAVRCVYVGTNATLAGFTLTNGATRLGWAWDWDSLAEYGGGGVWCDVGGVVSNCTLSSNSADYAGGGAYGGTLNNCTLSGNSANSGGGAYGSTLND